MSLLGILSKDLLDVRMCPANGRGWGCIIEDGSKSWRLAAFRGGGGAAAVRRSPGQWAVSSSQQVAEPGDKRTGGDALLASIATSSAQPYLVQAGHWVFAYEGTIEHAEALRTVLDPARRAGDGHRTPAEMIVSHLMTSLVSRAPPVTERVALIGATRDVDRARHLGDAAFLCSDGESLHGYAAGTPLALSNVADSVIIGSPDVVDGLPGARSMARGTLVSVIRRTLGWSGTIPDES